MNSHSFFTINFIAVVHSKFFCFSISLLLFVVTVSYISTSTNVVALSYFSYVADYMLLLLYLPPMCFLIAAFFDTDSDIDENVLVCYFTSFDTITGYASVSSVAARIFCCFFHYFQCVK